MKTLTDSTLSAIERASSKLGPFSSLLDKIMERVLPTVTASACSGTHCATTCTNIICGHHMALVSFWSSSPAECRRGHHTCSFVVSCTC